MPHDVTQTVNDDDVVTNTTTNNSDDQDGDVNVNITIEGKDDCGCNSCGCFPCCCGQTPNEHGPNVNVNVVKKNLTVNYGGPNYPVGYYDHQGGGVGANVSAGHSHGCGCGCEENDG